MHDVLCAGPGLEVTDKVTGRTFSHQVFLTAIHADTPARLKLAKWQAVGAYIACGWCLFQGSR